MTDERRSSEGSSPRLEVCENGGAVSRRARTGQLQMPPASCGTPPHQNITSQHLPVAGDPPSLSATPRRTPSPVKLRLNSEGYETFVSTKGG